MPVHSSQAPLLPTSASPPSRASTAPSTTASPSNPLPLKYSTGLAAQLITVTASSSSSTDATLQTWTRSGGTWVKVDGAVHAYLGRSGTSTDKHEGDGNTPAGSFTLTQAFGYKPDPGTALPYSQTTPADWWISQAGSLYNTHQLCKSGTDGNGCGYASPSEHLYYTQPNYQYAVVIDYNTRNAGTVRQGAGSAVFLHVQTGKPTSGCVSIEVDQLTRIMRWLEPSAHPRILIGSR
jgi:L,D-peptidoglycan transpeptidase YkuD (ErfK/YbiS/YcfS/YnhG family)